ncbi:MAG: TIGR02444 family protein [Xanthobacteraceae bacterium]
MNDTETKTETTPLWRFSLNFYRQAGVSEACVALQDGCGIDVNLLLFLFWLASEGRMLAADEVKKLDEEVRSWRELTIIPIRDTRRRLKGAPTAVDSGRQEAFRNKVKAVELEAERLQQEALYQRHRSGPLGTAALPKDAARANVGAYARAMGRNFPEKQVDVLIDGSGGTL